VEEEKRKELEIAVSKAHAKIEQLRKEVGKVIVGQNDLIERLMIALFTDGHILIEGVPGIAKTLTVNTLAKCLQLDFKRIQFTPDLLPSDLIGTSVFHPKEGTFSVEKGPVFTNVVLADEINRAPPKVQSALLEVMQEKQVTIAGATFKTKNPFFVLATQNPIEQEGTYPLPEAQIDRFLMKVRISYPNKQEEEEIVKRMVLQEKRLQAESVMTVEELFQIQQLVQQIYIDEKILHYILDIVFATRFPKDVCADIAPFIEYGASPRASLGLAVASKAYALLQQRSYVTPSDVRKIASDVLRHRLILSYDAEAQEITPDIVIAKIFEAVAVP